MAEIQLNNVVKRYGNTETIHHIDLAIDSGDFVVFVGPSGCGKSTLLRMIAGLETITDGTIQIGDQIVNHIDPAGRGIAMVFQTYALYPHMTVSENMSFGLRMTGHPKADIAKRVQQASTTLQLDALLDRTPKQLSGGQRQRVAIGRAIVRHPQVFLFDEPLSNLDAELRVEMRLQIAKLHQELKTTMIYVTHDQVEAMTLADKIVVINQGNIEQVGTPAELYHRPQNLFVAGFIGSPSMNLLPGQVVSVAPDQLKIQINHQQTITLQSTLPMIEARQSVVVGIRPEHLALGDAGDVKLTMRNEATEWLGNTTYLFGSFSGVDNFKVSLALDSNPEPYGELQLSCNSEHVHLFDEQGLRIN
ncbi:ABC transporter ATP-binding protein [Celerinatantimonas sp. YJH-8]|uniref:ABC transporter ATP-binding protein n=1 Tax=Celerinatantimonas sp. YJH-8 TaxID=3228714 RepID=UPI0038C2E927